jgi:hypothetical protein
MHTGLAGLHTDRSSSFSYSNQDPTVRESLNRSLGKQASMTNPFDVLSVEQPESGSAGDIVEDSIAPEEPVDVCPYDSYTIIEPIIERESDALLFTIHFLTFTVASSYKTSKE